MYRRSHLRSNLTGEKEIIVRGNICAEQSVSLRVDREVLAERGIERDSNLRAKRSRLTLVLPLRMWTRWSTNWDFNFVVRRIACPLQIGPY